MQTKLFELRDVATFIPIIATRMQSDHEQEHWLLRRVGYHADAPYYVLLARLDGGGHARSDKHAWGDGGRTLSVAHEFIATNWDDLGTGDVIDVEHILGMTPEPKISERFPPMGA